MARIVAIIQARMGSTRLPGKVLMEIAGRSMLWHVIERVRLSQKIDTIILAITTLAEDDQLESFSREIGLPCYRGEVKDVLGRYYGAATQFRAGTTVRICGDNPLIDPKVIDTIITEHLNSNVDYTSNTIKRTFPRGLDTEVFNYDTLERTYKDAKQDYEREHVTPYIYLHPEIFKLKSVEAAEKMRRPDLRLTVDTEEDLKLIREIFKRLYKPGQIIELSEVIKLLDAHPELVQINAKIEQRVLKLKRE